MPPTTTTPYTVPKWNPNTGEGSLTYLSNKTGQSIADILKANAGNQGIYYQGSDPRLREGATLNVGTTTVGASGAGSAPTVVGPGISSTTDYRNGIDQTANKLDEFANDPYMRLFEQARGVARGAEDMDRRQARATSAKFEKGAITESDRYKAGLETAGIQRGLSQYAPGLQADALAQAESNLQAKLLSIDNEEQLALAKAKQARSENDLSVMKEQLDYVQGLRKAKADALAEANKLAYDKAKFEYQQAQDERDFNYRQSKDDRSYALDVRRENRMAREGAGSKDKVLTPAEIEKLVTLYSLKTPLPYGTTQSEAEALLKDEVGAKPTEYLDLASGDGWFSIGGRSKQLKEEGLDDGSISYFEKMIGAGYTLEEALSQLPAEDRKNITDGAVGLLEDYISPIEEE